METNVSCWDSQVKAGANSYIFHWDILHIALCGERGKNVLNRDRRHKSFVPYEGECREHYIVSMLKIRDRIFKKISFDNCLNTIQLNIETIRYPKIIYYSKYYTIRSFRFNEISKMIYFIDRKDNFILKRFILFWL